MGGPCIPWKPGRTDKPTQEDQTLNRVDSGLDSLDASSCPLGFKIPENGRLPQAPLDADHVRSVFTRMGFNDLETVALMGAHCVGRCHPERSGYMGPWTTMPIRFINSYYEALTAREWVPKQWDGPLQFVDKNDSEQFVMMLPTDISLLKDPIYRPMVYAFARDNQYWFREFAQAYGKLLELGVSRFHG
jgi:catalase (peroxidase I)